MSARRRSRSAGAVRGDAPPPAKPVPRAPAPAVDSPLLPLLGALLAVAPLVIVPGQFEPANPPQMALIETGTLALVTLALARGERWPGRPRLPFATWLGALLGWAVLSLLWAQDRRGAIDVLRPWMVAAAVFALVVWLARTRAGIRRVLAALFAAGSAVAALGLGQALLGWQWVPQAFGPAATFMNKDVAVSFVVMVLPLALAVGGRGARARAWLGPLGAALMAGYVFQTFTKSGWLALAAEALAMGALLAWSRRRHGRGADLLASLSPASRAPLLTAAALVLVLVNVSPSGLRIGPFAAAAHLAQTWRDSGIGRPAQPVASLSDDERANSIRSRRAIWLNTAVMVREHALVGVGAGNHRVFYPFYARRAVVDPAFGARAQLDYAHNDYMQVLAELGLVGALLGAGALATLAAFLRRAQDVPEARPEALGLVLGLVGLGVDAAFNFPLERALPPVVAAVLLASAVVLTVPASASLALAPGRRRALALVAGVLLAASLVTQGRMLAADRHVLAARRAEAREDWRGVDAASSEALRLDRTRVDALFLRGTAWLLTGRAREAAGPLGAVVARHPYDLTAIGNLATAEAALGHHDEAAALYRRLAVLQPEDARVHANTARELEARGLMEEAEREWAEAARDDPAQAWYPYKRGVAAMKRGAADEAEASFTKALALNPGLAMAHKGLGVLLLGRPGRQAEARDHLRRALELDPATPDAARIRAVLDGRG